MDSEKSTNQEQQVDIKEKAKEIGDQILILIESHLSFLPDDETLFRNRYYLSSYFNIMKDVAIKIGKKMKGALSFVEIKKIGIDILETIEWEDIHKSPELPSISQLQESCNQNAQHIVVLSFESARNLLLMKGEPDNEETSEKAIAMVRKKFPNVPIEYKKEESITQEIIT